MGLKKKKNIIILTLCMVVSFILYQLYFFLTISSVANSRSSVIPVFDHETIKEVVHLRSEHDRFINENGVIKGVFFSHMLNYRPDEDNQFKCLKSEQMIPFEYVNDDYCDCEDGTDEPSTAACKNGIFYCDTQPQNRRLLPINMVPSENVNDGICDCCDGSDEWILDKSHKLLSQSDSKHYRHYVNKCLNNCQK